MDCFTKSEFIKISLVKLIRGKTNSGVSLWINGSFSLVLVWMWFVHIQFLLYVPVWHTFKNTRWSSKVASQQESFKSKQISKNIDNVVTNLGYLNIKTTVRETWPFKCLIYIHALIYSLVYKHFLSSYNITDTVLDAVNKEWRKHESLKII